MDRVGNGFGKAMVRLWHHTTAKDSQPIRREPLKKGANTAYGDYTWSDIDVTLRSWSVEHTCMEGGDMLSWFGTSDSSADGCLNRSGSGLKVVFPVKTGIAWDRDAVFAWFCEAKTP